MNLLSYVFSVTKTACRAQRSLMVCQKSASDNNPTAAVWNKSNMIPLSQTVLNNPHVCQPWINGQMMRTKVRVYYRPNAAKRIKTHGIHKRIQTESGVEILWRRFLKGRHNLAVYEDFRPLLKEFQRKPRKVKWWRPQLLDTVGCMGGRDVHSGCVS